MREQDRLSVLHVGATGHRDAKVSARLGNECVDDVEHQCADGARVVAQIHAKQGGDLVVA